MKRIGCLLLSATMILTLMPALAYTASAADISPKVIYSNDFENSSNLPVGKTTTDMVSNVNGSTAVSYDAKFDATSSWDEKVNVELNTEYADPISSGAKLQIDLLIPKGSAFSGSMKLAGVTKMGSGWIWTQSTSIPEVKQTDFRDTGKGYVLKTVEIPFGDEIRNNTGLHDIIFKIVGYQCNYSGKVYVDNARLIDGATTTAPTGDVYVNKTATPTAQKKIEPSTLNNIPASVDLVDSKATSKTASLYDYLLGISNSTYVIYGHQNDTHHKAVLQNSGTNSDTKDLTGSISGIEGIDALSLTGAELQLQAPNKDLITQAADVSINAAKEGAIVSLSAHMPNFAEVAKKGKTNGKYDYSGYTPNDTSGNVANRILPGGDLNVVYKGYLDMIAKYGKKLDAAGIPVLFRPFHEGNGGWFWWGNGHCDAATYKDLYRYTEDYLKNHKNVHNFIYVYSPNGPFTSEDDYLTRYPGDDYVDELAFDYYDNSPTATDNWISSYKQTENTVAGIAKKKNKLSAVAEVGIIDSSTGGLAISNNQRKDWFNEVLNATSGTGMSYFMTWANFNETNFFEPYMVNNTKGHEMINNFIDFYNKDNSVFANGIGNYGSIKVKNTNTNATTKGYIQSPTSGNRVLSAAKISASVQSKQKDAKVSFVIKNNFGVAVATLNGTKNGTTYTAKITEDTLRKIGKTYGSIELDIDGKQYDIIKIIFNIPEEVQNPTVVDDFESYGDSNDLLNLKWTTNVGAGCSVVPTLANDPLQHNSGGYGLDFKYNISTSQISEGYAGVTIDKTVDWSTYNALQFWCKPDGKGQKLVIQITSNGEDFEAHLSEFAATTEAKLVTIPFSQLVGKNNGKFDPTKVTKIGIWCNTIIPSGAASVDIKSDMYFDDIKAVNTDSKTIIYATPTINSAQIVKTK